mgnify:CR=1 FL=1
MRRSVAVELLGLLLLGLLFWLLASFLVILLLSVGLLILLLGLILLLTLLRGLFLLGFLFFCFLLFWRSVSIDSFGILLHIFSKGLNKVISELSGQLDGL